jgi:MFS family permease
MTSAHPLGPLHERAFRRLWLGHAISSAGDMLVPVALAFAVLGVGGSAIDLGRVFAGSFVARVALTLVGGVWADRLPRQVVMLSSNMLRAASQGTVAVLLITERAEIWHLLVASVVYGAAAAFFNPASTGLVPSVVTAGRLQQANALMNLTRATTYVGAPALSGALVAGVGPGWVFAVDAATFVVSAAFLATLRVPRAGMPARQRFLADLTEGWAELRARTWAWACIAFFSVFNLAIAFFYVLGPVVSEEELGGASDWGLIMAGAGVGSVLGTTLALRLRPRRPLLFGLSLSLMTPLQLFALVGPAPLPLIALAALFGLTAVYAGNALWLTTLQERVPPHALSRVTAYDWMGSELFMPIGYLIAGPLALALGRDVTLLAAGALLAAASLAVVSVPSVRRLSRLEPAEELAAASLRRATPSRSPAASAAGESRG